MNILIVTRSVPLHSFGGMEIVTWDLARAFKELGHRVRILTTEIPHRPQRFNEDAIETHTVNTGRPGKYSRQWWKESLEAFKTTLADETDVILSVSAGAYGLLDYNKAVTKKPIFLQAHGTSYGEVLSKLRTQNPTELAKTPYNLLSLIKDIKNYGKFDGIVAVGDAVYEDFHRKPIASFVESDKVHLIRNGIDTSLFSFDENARTRLRARYGIDESTKVIVSASRLHRQKGVHLGLEGFAKFFQTDPNSKYVVIGNGPEFKNLKRLAQHLGIESNVIFVGAIERKELPAFLSMGDLFLFTTLHNEGLPLNALEALATGLKVVISSHIEGITKIDNSVIPVDPKSVDTIAKALRTDTAEPRISYLPKEYSLEYCAVQYIHLFKKYLERNDYA